MVIDHKKILIVDDDRDLLDALQLAIDLYFHSNVKLEKASNGLEAKSTCDEFCPDIVITDLMMPIMDGIELCCQIKNSKPDTILVLMTGSDISIPNGTVNKVVRKPDIFYPIFSFLKEALDYR